MLEKAAGTGLASAQSNLAYLFRHGLGVERDSVRAFELYKSAAEQGFVEALTPLAECYEVGEGTPQNVYLAAQYYERAARNGDVQAAQKVRALSSQVVRRFGSVLSKGSAENAVRIPLSVSDAIAADASKERLADRKAELKAKRER